MHRSGKSLARTVGPGLFVIITLLAFLLPAVASEPGSIQLTPEEQAWLQAHPVIRLAPDPEFRPIEYFDKNGQYQGTAADHVRLLEKKLGIRITIVRLRNWDEVMDRFKRGEVDLLGAVAATPARRQYMLFTDPLVEVPGGIFSRTSTDRPLTIADLKGMKVAVVSNYMAHDHLRTQHPDLDLEVVPDVDAGLAKASLGMVDVYVENMANATYYLQRAGITNLRLVGSTDFSYRWGIGIRNDWPVLQGILNKGVAAISEAERKAIIDRWIYIEGQKWRPTPMFLLGSTTALVALLLLGFMAWNRTLRRQVAARTVSLERELTERQRAEEALRQLNADLDGMVHARTADLEQEIVERRKVAEALALSEQKFRLAFLSASDPIYIADLSGRMIAANDQASRELGYTLDELHALRVVDIDGPDRAEQVATAMGRVHEQGFATFETIHLRKDGTQFPVEVNARLIEYEGQPAILGVARDITERKALEERIRAINAELEVRVRERTVDLETSNRELEAFCYTISHDLRAPLRAINGYSAILREELAGSLAPEQEKVLDAMSRNARRMGELIDDLLEFSRLSRKDMVTTTIDMATLTADVWQDLAEHAVGREIVCSIPSLEPARGDAAMIRQVMENLLANAIKYTSPRQSASIEVGSHPGDGEIVYYVRDNGIGFDMQHADKLFGVFNRLHAAEAFEGTGIGLAIVKRIVEKHGGRVWAEGAPDQGATFHFSLTG